MKRTLAKRRAAALLMGLAALGGCAAPPSVVPLLEVAAEAVRAEAVRLDADAERDRQQVQARRQALADGFAADLRLRPALDAEWVASAAEVYAYARETLVRHEHALGEERRQRRENLELALQAHRRAIELLERHETLLRRVADLRLVERIHP